MENNNVNHTLESQPIIVDKQDDAKNLEIIQAIENENQDIKVKKVTRKKAAEVAEKIPETSQIVLEKKSTKKKKVEPKSKDPESENFAEEPVQDIQHDIVESIEIDIHHHDIDYSSFSKEELISLLEKSLISISGVNPTSAEFKKADLLLKDVKIIFEGEKIQEKQNALEKFISENESEDGFEYHFSEDINKFDALYKNIKERKFQYFANQEKNKEKNFVVKTELLNQLRTLTDSDDGSIASVKSNILLMKKIQQEWKDAGNITSPYNNTLWQTYHALVDRFYSNRSIYFELLELDRKKNLNVKVELCQKVEAIAEKIQIDDNISKHLNDAIHIFDEFKHIGPANKDANELLWTRFKSALDIIYNKRRSQLEKLKGSFEENYIEKLKVLESLALFTSFKSESINEWMQQTKALDILQQQWNAIKGPLPKDKARDISKEFWNGVKQFYKLKSDFFKSLESKRDENLKLKTALCEQAEAFLNSEEDSAENTKAVIKLQEDWRKIGHVPEKFRNKIYDRFKVACDGYFNKKRQKNSEADKNFQENLLKKVALCEKIESEARENSDIAKLAEIKNEWNVIGFVPKSNMQEIQKRYIDAINKYVGGLGKLSEKEKENISLQTEVEILKQKDKNVSTKDLIRKESDIRNKMQTLENDLSTLKNNLEFFARSKNAEKLKVDFEQKIKKGEDDLAHMKRQLKVIRQAAE